jgi:hypothetical protein
MSDTQGVVALSPEPEAHDKVSDNISRDGAAIYMVIQVTVKV